MAYDFDYGFDVDTLEDIVISHDEQTQANDGEHVSHSNEYFEGEREAIAEWLEDHRKSS